MRQSLISVLLFSLIAGCSSVNIGPHKIDVQQGNALDQENVSRLKLGLNRSQVRFLLGTPLVVDPFRTDRWDYVYVNYKGGKLAEQKRITLFFDGEVLARIEGDMPVVESTQPVPAPARQPEPAPLPKPKVEISTIAPVAETRAAAVPLPARAEPVQVAKAIQPATTVSVDKPGQAGPTKPSKPVVAATVAAPAPAGVSKPTLQAEPVAKAQPQTVIKSSKPALVAPVAAAVSPVAITAAAGGGASNALPKAEAVAKAQSQTAPAEFASTVVPSLPSPKNVPAYVDPRTPAEPSLQPETDVMRIKPAVIPSFPETHSEAAVSNDPVLQSVNTWVQAWGRRDEAAYLAAYDEGFIPQGGGSRLDWEKRRRLLLAYAKNIDVKIESPVVQHESDQTATVTFNQHYRSDQYRDSVVKQLRLVERDGSWLIVDEKVLSILRGSKL